VSTSARCETCCGQNANSRYCYKKLLSCQENRGLVLRNGSSWQLKHLLQQSQSSQANKADGINSVWNTAEVVLPVILAAENSEMYSMWFNILYAIWQMLRNCTVSYRQQLAGPSISESGWGQEPMLLPVVVLHMIRHNVPLCFRTDSSSLQVHYKY